MKLITRSKFWTGLVDLFNKWTTPIGISPDSSLRYWQERVVLTILFTGLILGFFAYIPSVRLCIKEQLWGVAFFDTAIYALVFVLFFFRRIPFAVRANAIILSSFLLGLVLLTIIGPSAAGPVWLFVFPVLAGVIIGVRTSIYALILNLIVLILIGGLIYLDYPGWIVPTPHTLERWIVISLNFILLNGIAAMSLAIVLQGLQTSLEHEKSIRLSMEHEIDERNKADKERKQAGEALRISEEKLQLIIDTSPVGICTVDPLGNFVTTNLAFEQMVGYAKEEFRGLSFFDVTHPDDRPNNKKLFQDMFSLKTTGFFVEKRYIRKDGTNIEVAVHVSGIMDVEGNARFGTAFVEDITERKRSEQEKKKLQVQLIQAQKMESIGNLAGGIAHDFNNILSSVIGFTELSLDEVEKGTHIEDNLQEVYTAGTRAKDLVGQILAFARQSDDELKPVQVDTVATEVLKFIRSSIPTTIEIRQNIESNSLIMGNATKVHQVLMNLFTNAAHAMEDKGGILEFSLKDVVVVMGVNREMLDLTPGNYIEIKVSDTGAGIAPEIIGSIFDPYFTTKGIGEGTGMGLAMVHGIIESYGGKISVNSKPDQGTLFAIYLPVTRKRQENRPYQSEELTTGTERILFVDDEIPIAKMGGQTLEKLGYNVSIRTSSIEALELFRTKPNDFDLVITDMTMPNMTGDRLAIELMKIRSDIPVVICTGYSKKMSDKSPSEMGIKAIIYKPIVKADLSKTVRKVLDDQKKLIQG